MVPEPQNHVAHRFKGLGSHRVPVGMDRMLTAIQFHNDLGRFTDEIDDIASYRSLTSELEIPDLTIAKSGPDKFLRICRVRSKFVLDFLHPNPSPASLCSPPSPYGRGFR